MSQPPRYTPNHSFVSDSATLANFPGQQLDVEFQSVKATTDGIETNLALIQRDDGALANGSVDYDQLSPSLQTNGLAPANAWLTGTAYALGISVMTNGALYRCLLAHTSDVFATDLATGKWIFVTAVPAPPPSPTTLGGVKSIAAAAHQFLTSIGTDGTPAQAQPAFSDVSGTAAVAQGGTGQITASAAFDALAPTTTRGDLIFRSATTNVRLAAGTSGYHLQTNGAGADPSWSGFTQSGTGAVARAWQDKARDIFSVKDFGPTANGIADDSGAFSLAAKAATAASLPNNTTVTVSQSCTVFVPAGTYLLSSLVDTGNRSVDWILEDGATITNSSNLNGRVIRESGLRMARTTHYGCYDTACSLSVTANYSPDEPPAVIGVNSDSNISIYAGRDSVAAYIANGAPAALYTLTAPTYTATTVSCPTPVDPKKIKVGMMIDTAHSPKWTGFITAVAANGTSITVSGWYQNGGGGTAGTPTSGVNATVNPITKIWAQNSGVTLNASSYGDAAAGYELDVYNNKADSNPYVASATGQTWGFDSYAVGPNKCSAGFVSRGLWKTGYVSDNALATAVGYVTKGAENLGFSYESSSVSGTAFRSLYNGLVSFAVSSSGDIEFGRTDAASTTVFDWHSSGNAIDYDARISCFGGTASNGQATLAYTALTHSFSGQINCGVLNPTVDFGTTATAYNKTSYVSGNSYFQSFSLNGTLIGSISGNGSTTTYSTTSDYRLKTNVVPMRGALDSVMRLNPVFYEWKASGEAGEGFIAHELAEICPIAVVGEKDAVDDNGVPVYQSIDTGFLVGRLTAAIQELKRELDLVKAQLQRTATD